MLRCSGGDYNAILGAWLVEYQDERKILGLFNKCLKVEHIAAPLYREFWLGSMWQGKLKR